MPPITKNLIIINVLFYFASIVAERWGVDLSGLLGLHFFLADDFNLYQLVTYMFMHGNLTHILFNMLAVWMFGRVMENVWGSQRFLLFYMVCGIGAGLTQELVQYISFAMEGLTQLPTNALIRVGDVTMPLGQYLNYWTTVGASGAVYGVLLAFGVTFPEERMFIFPLPIPIKAKFFVIGYAVLELLLGLGSPGDGVAHFAHLGGMIFGWFLIRYWRNNSGGSGTSSFWKNMNNHLRDTFKNATGKKPKMNVHGGKRAEDYNYNQTRKERSEEIDRILEKVKKEGYGSLTEEEKRKLFDASQQ